MSHTARTARPTAAAVTAVTSATGATGATATVPSPTAAPPTGSAPTAAPTPTATATATATATVDGTGARTAQAAAIVTGARARIDALDDRIIGLVRERMTVSALIQESRIASGGRRVNLSREMEVLRHYGDALGKPGTALAMTLLELCRGRI